MTSKRVHFFFFIDFKCTKIYHTGFAGYCLGFIHKLSFVFETFLSSANVYPKQAFRFLKHC